MGFVGNLLLFAAMKVANRPRIDKVIAMVRVAPFFDSQCIKIRHRASTSTYSLTFWIRVMLP